MNWQKIREYLFYLFIFSLPWQTRWIIRDPVLGGEAWEYGRISLYGWDILLVLLVIISRSSMVGIIKQWWVEEQKFKIQNSKFKIYFLLLILSFFSILWSGDKLLALVWSLRLLEAGLLWLLVLAIKPKLKHIFISLMAAGVIQALWAVGQFLTQSTFANKWLGVAIHPLIQVGTSVVLTEAGRWLRAYAGQVHPNVLGGLLVITCLATIYLFIIQKTEADSNARSSKRRNSYSNLLLLLYIIQLVGLFFTFSRGAWLALFISLIFYWFYSKLGKNVRSDVNTRFGRGGSIVIFTVIIFMSLSFIYWQPTVGRILGGSKLEQQSIEDRAGSVKESSGLLEQVWWKGTGMGNYTYVLSQNNPGLKAWYYQPVHNIFLLVLTELGIIGLLLFLWIWVSALLRKPLAIGHWLLAVVLVTSMFDHYWWTTPSMFLLMWLIFIIKTNISVAKVEDS